MRILIRLISAAILICAFVPSLYPQKAPSVAIKKKKAFVIDFKAPFDAITVDIDDAGFLETDNLVFGIGPDTTVLNKDKKPLDRSLIRPGMEIEIVGERIGEGSRISSIRMLTDLEKWNVEINGYFESLEGDKAWIGGQAVKLVPGAVIKGKEGYKGRAFTSFSDMNLGAQVTNLKGQRRADGLVYVTEGEIEPNDFSGGDKTMLALIKAGMLMPAKLEGGKGKIANKEVTFANDLALQTYVTKVGNRLVPRYTREYPDDYAGKLVWRFAVIEDESFNAFSLSDGSVFINTGLLKQIKNEAQLAAVIGHEIAHATYEHGRKNLEHANKMQWAGLGAAVGGKVVGGNLGALAAMTAVGAAQNNFGRDKEDQADRVGLYYMTQAGYDPREAAKLWREVSKNTKQDAITNFLYSDHSLARQRAKNLNREIANNYYNTDFSKAKVGVDEYMNVVGVYLGWKPAPVAYVAPRPMATAVAARTKTGRPVSTTAAASPVTSIIAFVVKQTNQPGSHSKGDVYVDITLEKFQYVVSLKTGKIVRKTRSTMKSLSGDYASVDINLMNARMKDTAQGGGWLLKKSGNTWQVVATAEGDWSCDKLRGVPDSVRRDLAIECF